MNEKATNTQTRDSHESRTNSPSQIVYVQDKSSLYVAVIAAVVGALALGALMMMPQIIDAKVKEGTAEARASMQQQAEEAKATAEAGRQHARVALDKVEDFRAKLAEKGIKIEPLDGH